MTWEELEALAAHNVHVHSWFCLMRNERITREEMLIGLAIHLAKVNERILAQMANAYQHTAPTTFTTKDPLNG